MPSFEIRVAETVDVPLAPTAPNKPTREVRSLVCNVEADNQDAAARPDAWGHLWEAKYGVGRLPNQALVEVAEVTQG